MKLPVSLPAAGEYPPAEPPLCDPEKQASDYIRRQMNCLPEHSGTLFIARTNLAYENPGFDNERDDHYLADIAAIMKASHSEAGKLPAAALLKAADIPEEYSCSLFESEYIHILEKITLLKSSGAAMVIYCGSVRLWQMRAAVIAANTAELPIMVIMQSDEDGCSDGGTDCLAALITLQSLGAASFGIESTCGTDEICRIISGLYPHAGIPLAVLCSSGSAEAESLVSAGASVILLQQDTSAAETINAVTKMTSPFIENGDPDCLAAAVESEAFFLSDDLVLSVPVECSYDIAEDLIDLDDENINSILIMLNSSDDVSLLAAQGGFSRLPVAVNSNDLTTLEAALRYFPGRLIVDTHCEIPYDEICSLSSRYGAILY